MKKPMIYISPTCPYCKKVMNFASENKIDIEYKDRSDKKIREELVSRAGKTQVPYLVDNNKSTEMHESDDIITHLKKHYL